MVMARGRLKGSLGAVKITRLVLLSVCPFITLMSTTFVPEKSLPPASVLYMIGALWVMGAVIECTGLLAHRVPFCGVCGFLALLQMSTFALGLGLTLPLPVRETQEGANPTVRLSGLLAKSADTKVVTSTILRSSKVQGAQADTKVVASTILRSSKVLGAQVNVETVAPTVTNSSSTSTAKVLQDKMPPNPRFSVVLACAEEGEFAVKTAQKINERTPSDVLQEIVMVDDGSFTLLTKTFDKAGINASAREKMRLRIIRHPESLGLMIAKKTGGDAASGDIIVFLDCHVSPSKGWHTEIQKLIVENPRRMVVPAITDLDLDTWEERENSAVNTKCYLTWDADFNWFEDASPYVPVMSGGLLALSKYWWTMTGGYDNAMRGWGGENLDQSLRSWLCGGEIMRAPSSRVAHMWRTSDPRTRSRHRVPDGHHNLPRVVAAWYGPFKAKYPNSDVMRLQQMDVSSITTLQRERGCKPFVHFLHRFRSVYVAGGVLPRKVFQLRDKKTGLCMGLQDVTRLERCQEPLNPNDPLPRSAQWHHWANRNPDRPSTATRECCSGLREWSSNMCLDYADEQNSVHGYLCDVTGQNRNQQYHWMEGGKISHLDGRCLVSINNHQVGLLRCDSPQGKAQVWEQINSFEPFETKLYRNQLLAEGLKDEVFTAEMA